MKKIHVQPSAKYRPFQPGWFQTTVSRRLETGE
jgi:hypothetical protein